MITLKLHNYFRSSASYRVRIALALKGLAYDYLPVHIARGDHKTGAFAALSPDALVPLLEIDGLQLTQSLAIIDYLDEQYPTPPLLPPDAAGRAMVRAMALSIACDVHPVNNLRVLKYLTQTLQLDETAKNTWYQHWCRGGLVAFENQLQRVAAAQKESQNDKGGFCYGSTPTLADCCLVPQIFNAQRFKVDLSGLPLSMAVFECCSALPAFVAAHPSNCPDYEP